MPILFVSGIVWPSSLIPQLLTDLSYLIPAIPAIHAMLQLSKMGGQWQNSIHLWLALWLMVVVYGTLVCYLISRKQQKNKSIILRNTDAGI
jgi:ABC-2 type transport system permease protein